MRLDFRDIRDIREQLLTYILITFAVFGPIALAGSLSRMNAAGWRFTGYFYIFAYLLVLLLAVFRRRIPSGYSSLLLITLMFVVGVLSLIIWGLTGTGVLLLATSLVFITLFWGVRAGTAAGLVNLLIVAVVGWCIRSGLITLSFDTATYQTSSLSWINALTSCFLCFAAIIGCTGFINNRLLALSENYRRRYHDLIDVHNRVEKSETHYRTLFNTARDAIFIMKENRFIDCNPRTLEMFGCSREEIIDSTPGAWSPEFQPDGSPSVDESEKAISAAYSGMSQRFEWVHRKKDGALFDVEVSLAIMDVYDPPHILAIVRDITDRKTAERALRQSEDELRRVVTRQALILDSLPMAFYTAEVAGPYGRTWVSDQVSRISGFPSQTFISDKCLWRSRIHADDYPAVMEAFDSLGQKKHISVEYRWEHHNGGFRWFQDHAVLVENDKGAFREIIGTWLDIDQKKKAEAERERLEHQLVQSQKMEVIGTLTGGIAHDFNNILFPMIGYLEMIIKALAPEDVLHRRVSRVLEGARRAESLVRQILSVSRRKEEDTRPLNVETIVKEAVDLSRSSLPASIEIMTDIDKHIGNVVASPTHIHQIVMNMVTNAYHAMEENGGRLEIRLKPFRVYEEMSGVMNLTAGHYILLSVSDSGTGMTPETVKRVFDPYFTTKEPGKGTGLGMFITHGLVQKLNGKIEVESEPGSGSIFRVYLPDTPMSENNPDEKTETVRTTAGNEHILVVDDEKGILRMFQDLLTDYGYQILTSNSSRAALEMIRSGEHGRVDLLITDMMMPEMNGLELAEKVHALYPDIPAILMTGYTGQITREKMDAADIRDTLLKPVSPTEILEKIRRLLDGRSHRP